LMRNVGYLAKVVVHLAVVFGAFLLAYELRRGLPLGWWLTDPLATEILVWGVLYAAVAASVELVFRTERESWRFSSLREVVALARSAVVVAAAFLTLIFFSNRAITLPRSTLILSCLLSLCALVGVRVLWRLTHGGSTLASMRRRRGIPLTLVGDVGRAETYLRRTLAEDEAQYNSVAIVAQDAGEVGQFIHGVPVVGNVGDFASLLTPSATRPGPSAIPFRDWV
jgi:O-antigen biosynthesis protein WbqV